MKNDERNMGIRTISGAVIILTTALMAMLSSYSFALFNVVVALVTIYELFKICEKSQDKEAQDGGYAPQYPLAYLFCTALIVLNFTLFEVYSFSQALSLVGLTSLFALPLMVVVILFVEIFRNQPRPLANSALTLFALIYIALPISIVGVIPRLMCAGEWSGGVMLAYFFLLWANDSFAYLFGVTMGRHPLMKRISPKKSVEGFIGGVIGAAVISLVAAWILGQNLYVWVGLSIVVSLSAVFGDLVESMIKRSINVKDSGSIIPGHGGFWDRFDSYLYSIPPAVIYLYALTLLKIC